MTAKKWLRRHKVEVTFKQAVVSFCSDLTDPNGECTPIGVLLLARTDENEYYAAAAGARAGVDSTDPVTTEFLSDFPEMLRRHLESAMESAGGSPSIDAILNRLHDSLRTSLSVTEITESHKTAIEPARLHEHLVREVILTLVRATKTNREEMVRVPAPQRGMHGGNAPGPRRSLAPEAMAWPLEPCPA